MSKIGDLLRKYDSKLRIVPTNDSQAFKNKRDVDKIFNLHMSLTNTRSNLLDIMEKDMKLTGECRAYLAKEPWDIARFAFAFPKNSKLTPIFNKQ